MPMKLLKKTQVQACVCVWSVFGPLCLPFCYFSVDDAAWGNFAYNFIDMDKTSEISIIFLLFKYSDENADTEFILFFFFANRKKKTIAKNETLKY